jgi:hypothetical protein
VIGNHPILTVFLLGRQGIGCSCQYKIQISSQKILKKYSFKIIINKCYNYNTVINITKIIIFAQKFYMLQDASKQYIPKRYSGKRNPVLTIRDVLELTGARLVCGEDISTSRSYGFCFRPYERCAAGGSK